MKKAMDYLLFLTVVLHMNNLTFAYVNSYIELTGVSALWVLSPYLLITLSSFILALDYKEQYAIFKKEAIVGIIIKIVACSVAFFNHKFEIGSIPYMMRFVLLIILFGVNLYIEYRMYKKAQGHILKVDVQKEEVSEEDKLNIRNYGKAVTKGLASFIFVAAFGMNVTLIAQIEPNYIWICIPIFLLFLKMNYDKIILFYGYGSIGKRIFWRDAIYAIVGFGFNFLLAADVIYTGEYVERIAIWIGIFLLYPTARTNRKMALKQRKVSKALGDDFDYYYDQQK
jgi:hypothetical protein